MSTTPAVHDCSSQPAAPAGPAEARPPAMTTVATSAIRLAALTPCFLGLRRLEALGVGRRERLRIGLQAAVDRAVDLRDVHRAAGRLAELRVVERARDEPAGVERVQAA